MLFERDHINPDIKHALEHARVLRAQFLRQLFSRKKTEPEKSPATSLVFLNFFRHPRRALRNPTAAASPSS